MKASPVSPVFARNCILNYLRGELEGREGIPVAGPATFGEIAHIPLNRTLVLVEITERRPTARGRSRLNASPPASPASR